MTTTTRPLSYPLAPALFVLGILLALGNWYLQPERAAAWAAAIATLFLIAAVWGGTKVALRRSKDEAAASRGAGASITSAATFAGLMMVIALGVKLAVAVGALESAEVGQRATMAIVGAFLAFTGNALPKTLSALHGDGSKTQAFQRFAGWTWTLTGLAFAIAWLVFPPGVAKTLSLVLLPGSMLIVAAQAVRLRGTCPRAS